MPRLGHGGRRRPRPDRRRALGRQDVAALQAAGVRRADRDRRQRLRRPARDRRPVRRSRRPPSPGGDLAQVERAVDEELARFLARRARRAAELQRVKTGYRAGFVRGIERIGGFGGKSDVLAQGEVFAGRPDFYKTRLQRVAAATRGADPGDRQPLAHRRRLHARGAAVRRAPGRRVGRRPLQAPRERRRRPTPSSPSSSAPRSPTGSRSCSPSATSIPQVRFSLLLDAGYAADQFGIPGTASLAMAMLDEGTRTRNSLGISDELAALGANSRPGSRLDMSIGHAVGAEGEAGRLARALRRRDAQPVVPAHRLRAAQAPAPGRDPAGEGGSHRHGAARLPDAALRSGPRLRRSLDRLGHRGIRRPAHAATTWSKFHRTWFKPNNATLIVVGDTTMAEIRPKLERAFAGWTPGDVPAKNIAHRRAAADARPSTCSTGPRRRSR